MIDKILSALDRLAAFCDKRLGRWTVEVLTVDGVVVHRAKYDTYSADTAERRFREEWQHLARSPEMRSARRVEFFHTAPGGDPCGNPARVIWI